MKPSIRETGESWETIICIFIYVLSLTKSNNWFIFYFLPWIINLVQLEDEEELQQKNIWSHNLELCNRLNKEYDL